MTPSSVWMMTVTSPHLGTSFMTSMNAEAGAKRRISSGRASTTSRTVAPVSLARLSITTPGSAATLPRSASDAFTPRLLYGPVSA
jgi:hypothetical protein